MYRVPKPRRYLAPEEIARATAMAQGVYDGHHYTAAEACRTFGLARAALVKQVPAFEDTCKRRKNRNARPEAATTRARQGTASGRRRQSTSASRQRTAAAGGENSTDPEGRTEPSPSVIGNGHGKDHSLTGDPGASAPGALAGAPPSGGDESGASDDQDRRPHRPKPPQTRIETLPNHDYKTGQTVRLEGSLLTVNALLGKDRLILEDDNYNKVTVHSSLVSRPFPAGMAAA